MEAQYLSHEAIHAYLELIELNMRSWRPEVAEWLHSDESAEQLAQLLLAVPCSPTVH
jgi:hypothetical protein